MGNELIGYARVSTDDQNLDLQQDALKKAGCKKIFTDKMSGARAERPGLTDAMTYARAGDTIVVWKLSRLGRSTKQLIETAQIMAELGIELKSLNESIDTTTAAGKLFFTIIAAFAQFERESMVENTKAGVRAARARGKSPGRPIALDPASVNMLRTLAADPSIPIGDLCKRFNIKRSTYYNYVKDRPAKAV